MNSCTTDTSLPTLYVCICHFRRQMAVMARGMRLASGSVSLKGAVRKCLPQLPRGHWHWIVKRRFDDALLVSVHITIVWFIQYHSQWTVKVGTVNESPKLPENSVQALPGLRHSWKDAVNQCLEPFGSECDLPCTNSAQLYSTDLHGGRMS